MASVDLNQVSNLNISEESFTFPPESFDFVNCRFIGSGIASSRWPTLVTDIRRSGNLVDDVLI